MLDEDHREPAVADLADEVDERLLLGGVEAGGRLVEEEDLGLGGQRPGDLEPSLVAVGQVAGGRLGAVGDADELEQASRLVLAPALLPEVPRAAEQGARDARRVPGVGAHHDVLHGGHVREQPDVLERAGHAGRGDVVRLLADDRLAVELDLAARWVGRRR